MEIVSDLHEYLLSPLRHRTAAGQYVKVVPPYQNQMYFMGNRMYLWETSILTDARVRLQTKRQLEGET